MIIWVNGAFGSGKTQAAFELHRRQPDSFVFDPENAGYYIRKNIPNQLNNGDFQNYTMWRDFNYSILKYISKEYNGVIIVPMTIVNPQYFNEIIVRLRNDGIEVNHFTLCASREILIKRLKSRGDGKNSWPAQQIDRCLKGLSNEIFKQFINTNNLSIEEIVNEIALQSNISLLPDKRSKMRKIYDYIVIKLKQIR
jgi:RNase adaptor protein for sRNA GlmZ degradation